jgi:serine/threonine-protein kinase
VTAAPDRLAAALADRYRIERELGRGGMATVYLADDLKHGRRVAIKVLRPELAMALGAERFLREIAMTASLRHPHILPLYDSGEAAGFLYYVMPLVEGESLRDRLTRQKQLPIDEALTIAREVADALGYAHQRGVTHRDIKPENILIEGGHAVVADFGIARVVGPGVERLTETGLSIGTPLYMSPEQVAADPDLDGRSDLYSLGCVLYEMLGGQPPFTGPTAEAVTRQHMLVEAAPITNLRPTVPPEVAGALARSLAKNPADRFNPVAQFADALRPGSGVARAPSVPAAAAAAGARKRRWIGIAALGITAMVAAVLIFWRHGSAAGPPGSASVAVLPFVDLSPDRSSAYLGDGISETLINALANVPGLSVAARTSAFAFRDKREDVREIGRQLGVATVLEGSVQRSGDRLRVTAQLIKTGDGLHLWSENFDRGAGDIFAVQDEVARAVANALQLRLVTTTDSGHAPGGTRDPAAYDAYLLGRYHWNRRTTEGMIDAAAAFKRALAIDSSYAQAWAGLADTYVLSIPAEYDVPGMKPDSILPIAEAAARRAIALAPRLGEAYASLGEIVEYRGRREEARDAYQRAIALAPGYATGHQWYGYYLAGCNQWDEAIHEMEVAHRLDPLSHVITLSLAALYDGGDRVADATPLYEQGLAQSPEAYYAWFTLMGHELALGHLDKALAAFEKSRGWPSLDTTLPRFASQLRDPSTRTAAIDAMARSGNPVPATVFSRWLRGDDATLSMLERVAAAGRDGGGSSMNMYLALGPKLRADPRFLALLPRLGFPPQGNPAAKP